MKGLIIEVFHPKGYEGYTNNLLGAAKEALLVGEGIPQLFEANGLPVLRIVERNINGIGPYKHLQPVEPGQWAYGGCIGYTNDSRFPSTYPLKIHDYKMG
jgi:hypothetical protein